MNLISLITPSSRTQSLFTLSSTISIRSKGHLINPSVITRVALLMDSTTTVTLLHIRQYGYLP